MLIQNIFKGNFSKFLNKQNLEKFDLSFNQALSLTTTLQSQTKRAVPTNNLSQSEARTHSSHEHLRANAQGTFFFRLSRRLLI